MKRALWLLGLVGCVNGEPDHQLPVKLELDGDLDIVNYHQRIQLPTAVGGTQTFHVNYARNPPGIPGPAFDQPYTAMVADNRLRIEDQRDTSITIRGVAPGQSTVRLLHDNGSLIDEFQLSVAEIENIVLDPVTSDVFPNRFIDRSFAWAPGEQTFRIELYRGTERLGDSSMQLALAGAERSGTDVLHVGSAVVGTYPISVTAGDWPTTTLDFVVVDRADSVSLITGGAPPTSLRPGDLTALCFEAQSAGRYLVGVTWTISVVGEIERQPPVTPNCVDVVPRQASGDITVSAAAAGQSLSITLPVVAM